MKWLLVAGIVLMGQPALAAQNDLVVDFGATGLWVRLNNTTWKKIDKQSPIAVAACSLEGGNSSDKVIASFPGRGLEYLRGLGPSRFWSLIHEAVPEQIVTADFDGNGFCDIAALVKRTLPPRKHEILINLNFSPYWLHTFSHVPPPELTRILVADLDALPHDDLVVEHTRKFQPPIIVYNNNFGRTGALVDSQDQSVASGDLDGSGQDEIISIESPKLVVVQYDPPSNRPIHIIFKGLVTTVIAGNIDTDPREDVLIGNGNGVWAYYNDTLPLVRLDTRPTKVLAIADLDSNGANDIVASFGNIGIAARYNNAARSRCSPQRRRNCWFRGSLTFSDRNLRPR